MAIKLVKFIPGKRTDFYPTLKKRIDQYFKSNNLSRNANRIMVIKTVTMLSLYFGPYLAMLIISPTSFWFLFGLWILMGIGVAGVGLSIMHDANHGSYSKNKKVNLVLGKVMDLIGGNSTNWKIQHNVLHHTYTNIEGLDEDIQPGAVMRFSPHAKKRRIHKLQFLYAWFFYGIMTLSWVAARDFTQLLKYSRNGLISTNRTSLKREMIKLVSFRVVYFLYTLVLPAIFLQVPFWYILLGFLAMHFVAGLILACIFQPAHVIEDTDYPVPANSGNIENEWAIHQLLTTTNFAPGSKIFSWFVGGLNFQIEHHLFPNICHIHYKKLSTIVKTTAREFGLPYYVQPTFAHALWKHGKMLKELGR